MRKRKNKIISMLFRREGNPLPLSQTSFSSGFTLIEVIVSSAIFIVFAGSMMALFTMSSRSALINKHRLEASNLAREGIELTNQISQTAKTRGVSWGDLNSGTGWHFEDGSKTIIPPPLDGCVNNDQCLGTGSSSPITLDGIIFDRTITISHPNSNTIKVESDVVWEDYGVNRTASEVSYITNW